MAGEGVAQHVRVQVLAELAHAGLAHAQLDRPWCQALAATADEQRAIRRIGQGAQQQPGLDGLAGETPDRQFADLVALADHADHAVLQVQPLQVEADQFGQAQAG
ncbi:hypothetical protein D3C78_1709760 [compost metagenome]